jgi:hypothetical protein
MRSRVSENESLKKAFRDAHSAKGRGATGEEWESCAMRRIRQIGPLRSATGFWSAFENLVWRLAPVSCVLVLVLTFLFVSMDFGVDPDYLATMAAEMEKPILAELFDIEGWR